MNQGPVHLRFDRAGRSEGSRAAVPRERVQRDPTVPLLSPMMSRQRVAVAVQLDAAEA
jgi:hypothetical protein